MDVFIHVANVIYLVSYLVRDILWLRVLTVVAGSTLMPFYYYNGLWAAIAWNVLFVTINGEQIRRLFLERRPVLLTELEQALYDQVFRSLSRRDFRALVDLGEWVEVGDGSQLVEQGQDLDQVLIHTGVVDVRVGDNTVNKLGPGCFVGEISFLTGATPSASVITASDVCYVAWRRDALRALLDTRPELRAGWQFLIGSDLAAKLTG